MRCSSAEQALSEWMNDLVDRSQHSDWIPDNSCCFRVRPITCSPACLYGNLLNGCQGLKRSPIHSSLYGVENYMLCGGLVAKYQTLFRSFVVLVCYFLHCMVGFLPAMSGIIKLLRHIRHHYKMADPGNSGLHSEWFWEFGSCCKLSWPRSTWLGANHILLHQRIHRWPNGNQAASGFCLFHIAWREFDCTYVSLMNSATD